MTYLPWTSITRRGRPPARGDGHREPAGIGGGNASSNGRHGGRCRGGHRAIRSWAGGCARPLDDEQRSADQLLPRGDDTSQAETGTGEPLPVVGNEGPDERGGADLHVDRAFHHRHASPLIGLTVNEKAQVHAELQALHAALYRPHIELPRADVAV